MDSYQPFSPSFKSSLAAAADKPAPPEPADTARFIGFVDVFIHEARDIHNICIYHKQDVYAKLYLTNDPESAVSTQIINGGGKNPVFNQRFRLNVRTVESSVKCEVWMLSRVRNYLEDQLLGLALVPLTDVVVANGKLEDEFSLSSTDLFHSPAGLVKMSIAYVGSSPEVMAVVTPPTKNLSAAVPECEFDLVEFPDLNVASENKMMVSEYFGIPCANDEPPDHDAGVRVVESFAAAASSESVEDSKKDTPGTSASITGKEEESDSATNDTFAPPVIKINVDMVNSVVQQDIVDMYTKSMQQFTESLANMKLPMDMENSSTTSSGSSSNVSTANGDSGADLKSPVASKKTGPRVFYGSRAFF